MTSKKSLRRQLRELAEVRPEAEDAQRAIAAARAAVVAASSQPRPTLWSLVMQRPRSFAAAATLLIAAALAFVLTAGNSPRSAFAQVLERVEGAKTVQYLETQSSIPRAGEPRGPATVIKVMILGRHRERTEVLAETPGEPLEPGHSWSKHVVSSVLISDLEHGKLVSLDPKTKTFREVKSLVSFSVPDGKLSEVKVSAAPEINFYARMRDIPVDQAEELPARELDGKNVIGFRTVEKHAGPRGVETWTRTYWVDAATKLPVQIETTVESTDPQHGQSRSILSDIVFDEPLDESLFSTDPPEGYTVQGE